MRPFCALGALLVMFVFAPSATAVPDGPVDVYLEHLEALAGAPISLAWPAQGTVTDGFGPRWGRMHLGIDVGILTSLAVRAAAPGTVTAAGYLGRLRGLRQRRHGRRRPRLHDALRPPRARQSVRPGDWLELGEPLGSAGCTGSCTGTHLHFELRRAGVPVDPSPFLG